MWVIKKVLYSIEMVLNASKSSENNPEVFIVKNVYFALEYDILTFCVLAMVKYIFLLTLNIIQVVEFM